jgi:hypothetical protein
MLKNLSLPKAFLFLIALLWPIVARPQIISPPKPVTPRDFALMAWGTSPADPEQLRLMKEAGLNISGFCRVEDLERVSAAGLACFVRDDRVNGYDWKNLPPEELIRANIMELSHQTIGRPALFGFFLRDEPSAAMMAGLGHVADILRESIPGTWPYVNLFPTYANRAQLGSVDYEAYVKTWIQSGHPPFLSYDNYSPVEGEMRDFFFTNLEMIRRLCLEAGIPFWNCILALGIFNLMEPSDATFNLQVYSTLAYGGRGIEYFMYFTPPAGNSRLGAIDQFGNRTPTWDLLRRINYQVQALTPTLVRLRSTGVYHGPEVPLGCHPITESRLLKQVEMLTPSIWPPVRAHYLAGEFEDAQSRPYLMLVNKDLTHSFLYRVHLKQEGRRLLQISPYSGLEEPLGGEINWLAPGAGVLLRIE